MVGSCHGGLLRACRPPPSPAAAGHGTLHHPLLLSGLSKHASAFPVSGESVHILRSPSEFYQTLKDQIRAANHRLLLSSLYIGTGPLEQQLLDVVADSLGSKPSLQALFLFDALRSTRTTRPEEGRSTEKYPSFKSSAEMLTHVLLAKTARWKQMAKAGDQEDRLRVALYRTPDLTKGLERILPARLNEVVGVCHMKAYIFDDHVLMSGANLSTSYFTNRQDRYIIFRDCKNLADYLCELVEAVASFSYLLGSEGALQRNTANVDPRFDPVGFRREMFKSLEKVVECGADQHPFPNPNPMDLQGGLSFDGHTANTWVFPTVQMGPLGIRQDELCILWLLENLPAQSCVHFASAYFNLTREFEATLLQASLDKAFKILTAAPQANGFYGSGGISGLIPKAYSLLEKSFYERTRQQMSVDNVSFAVKDSDVEAMMKEKCGIQIFEYKKQGWTFHAKGLWCYLPSDGCLPSMTLIGSSNFGFRSRQRDLEAQLYLITLEPSLRSKLQQETDFLFLNGEQVNPAIFLEPDRSGGPVSQFAAQLVRSWL